RCADPACPSLVRADCQVWGTEVQDSLPKIVFRLGAGVNPEDVYVLANGEPIVVQYGVPMVFEPGPLVFEIGVAGQPSQYRHLDLTLEQPYQTVDIQLPPPAPPPPAPAAVETRTPIPPREAPKSDGIPTASYVLAGIAIAGAS